MFANQDEIGNQNGSIVQVCIGALEVEFSLANLIQDQRHWLKQNNKYVLFLEGHSIPFVPLLNLATW